MIAMKKTTILGILMICTVMLFAQTTTTKTTN